MTSKRGNIFLFLALACFLGIVLIFVFDGYIGVYDSFKINNGEYPQEIEPDYWLRQDDYRGFVSVQWDGKADFEYEIDNRRFLGYSAALEVSAWRDEMKLADIISEEVSLDSFTKYRTFWVLDTSLLLPGDISPDQGYQFTLLVKRGDVERRIIVGVSGQSKPVLPR